ncbi:SDR family oxidoreductase [Streptomyces bathyalis]|uniref:SDR family oxidoreductase n=1 Tax=Streptomyces bathyalis TaxID=2710756 RepID=A0A7T1WSK4_9ACTN|nr:SDR family oxidoreductase [Streptomyces bathyalis]QPP05845.1 SDR family oxidoreductase [Streptomyces bathyalis]
MSSIQSTDTAATGLAARQSLPLYGKAALVTGGSRGIGAAIALRLAADGADVTLTYDRSVAAAEEVAALIEKSGGRVLAVRADCADPAAIRHSVEACVTEFGRLDILVNNAGVGATGPVGTMQLADIDQVLAVNVRGPYLASQAAEPHLADGGRIVNIGSCVGERVVFPGMSLYATSKAALNGLTRALARELGPRGVTVNLVAPGPVDTDMNPADGQGADAQAAFTARGRYGEADDVAATVAHLVGDGGRNITGASIAVDGGFNA